MVQWLNPVGGGGGAIFPHLSRPSLGPTQYNEYRVFPGDKELSKRDVDPSPPSSAVVKKEQSYTSTPPMGRTACTELQCMYKGALYLFTYTYVHSYINIPQIMDSL